MKLGNHAQQVNTMLKPITLALSALLLAAGVANAKPMSDQQIKRAIIKESIESYYGNCPCPYNTARNGSSCGRRSAYSRPGGEAPICYEKDVTKEMVKEYREHLASQ
ncbi:hypothetical protein [Chromobacterium phragmitis]|uniref:hypothetical protein n=1 Tax=Chromobacterium phragmitis TaxID=2202141 RepID=UPI001E40F57E|nr:hypothetical protein [Chromobacterium phragmitis]